MKFITLTGGHGGTDSGAVGNGHKEKDVAMKFANLVSKYLKLQYTGMVITVQQEKTTKGEFKSVSTYWNKSNTGGGYSFHLNANSGTPGHGTEVLKGKFGSARCDAVNHALAKWFDNRGVKNTDTNNFYMLREAGFDGIFEICFINNASDMKILMDNIEEIAKEVALAIGKVEGLMEKKSNTTNKRNYKKFKKVDSYYNDADGKDHSWYLYYMARDVACYRVDNGKRSGTIKKSKKPQLAYPCGKDSEGNSIAKFYNNGKWHKFITVRK